MDASLVVVVGAPFPPTFLVVVVVVVPIPMLVTVGLVDVVVAETGEVVPRATFAFALVPAKDSRRPIGIESESEPVFVKGAKTHTEERFRT